MYIRRLVAHHLTIRRAKHPVGIEQCRSSGCGIGKIFISRRNYGWPPVQFADLRLVRQLTKLAVVGYRVMVLWSGWFLLLRAGTDDVSNQ